MEGKPLQCNGLSSPRLACCCNDELGGVVWRSFSDRAVPAGRGELALEAMVSFGDTQPATLHWHLFQHTDLVSAWERCQTSANALPAAQKRAAAASDKVIHDMFLTLPSESKAAQRFVSLLTPGNLASLSGCALDSTDI